MGAGGTAGAVSFPAFLEDIHGHLIASTGVNTAEGSTFTDQNFTKPDQDVMSIINTAWDNNPYSNFDFTDPADELDDNEAQFDLYYAAVTSYDRDNYASYITSAIQAITGASTAIAALATSLATSAPSSPENLFIGFATTMRSEISKGLAVANEDVESDLSSLVVSAASDSLAAVSLTAATTLWRSLISAATSELKKCNLPKEISPAAVVAQAASNAKNNLREALRVVKSLVTDQITQDIITAFDNRRETTYQRQVAEFSATMADVNAVNSTAFLFGSAVLRSEQMREVAEFDTQISFQLLERGLSAYIQSNLSHLQVSANVELANANAHNALLQASIQLLAALNAREEITPRDLLSIYGGLFASEMQLFSFMAQAGIEGQANLYGQNINKERVAHELRLRADAANKQALESRYQIGLQQTLQLLTNRTEFERIASQLILDQNKFKIDAQFKYEGLEIEDLERETLWDLNIAKMGAEIFAAPSGMSASVPKFPHPALQTIGTITQGVAAVGSVAGGGGG